ncbi:hypothetical protein ACU4GR_14840 [Methylobacterium oryzae CBMB20]
MIYNLQILRAVASYLVFLTHFGLYIAPVLPRPDLLASRSERRRHVLRALRLHHVREYEWAP